jgi:sugar/nucleoside kinase (ribokinase family)
MRQEDILWVLNRQRLLEAHFILPRTNRQKIDYNFFIMAAQSVLRFVIAGRLQRNFILTPQGKALLDVPGGNLFYAAAGLSIWEQGLGLIGRVGEDYPQHWLADAARRGIDVRGVRILPEALDSRFFAAYPDAETASLDNPVAHFGRVGLPYPKSLLGYAPPEPTIDSRTRPTQLTIRQNDFPDDYLDATAAHLCPLDFLSHTLLPSVLRRGNISTLTLDPAAQYMTPTFWDDMPVLINRVTGFLCSEDKLTALFQGRSNDLWEMAETIASYGCEIVVVKRGSRGQYLYIAATKTRWTVPAYPVQVVDPTGAGDAFCGGFLAGYRSTYDPLHAVLAGNVSAAMTLEGTHPMYALDALPGLAVARLEALRDMVRKV